MNTIKTYGDFIKANPDDEGAKRLKAAIEGDERTRLESLTVEAGPEPKHMPVICCRWHALAHVPAKHIDTSAVAINYPINPTA